MAILFVPRPSFAAAARCAIKPPPGHERLFDAMMRQDFAELRKAYAQLCAMTGKTVCKSEKVPAATANVRSRQLTDGPCAEVFPIPGGKGQDTELLYLKLI